MKKLILLLTMVSSLSSFAATITSTYTFKTHYPLVNGFVSDQKGNQFAIDCKTLDLVSLTGQGTNKFKNEDECREIRSLILGASDEDKVEIDVSENKVMQVRAHK